MRMSAGPAVLASAAMLFLMSDLAATAMTLEQAYAECSRKLQQTTDYNGIVAQAIEGCARQKMQESPSTTTERRPRHISRPAHREAPAATEATPKQGGGDSGGR